MSRLDELRARAHAKLTRLPGRAGELARKTNEMLGRPLADSEELADRRDFSRPHIATEAATPVVRSAAAAEAQKEAAPVIVYHMDKSRRDAEKLTQLLADAGVPYQISNIQEDPAAQMAVRRDSKGYRLPVVFVAGEPIGGRAELTNLLTSGELKKKVFGA